MIKFLLAAIFTLPMLTEAQTAGRIVEGNIFPGIGVSKNHVRNPQANKNETEGITASTISITRNTTPPTLFDGANFLMTAGGAGTVYWSLLPLDAGMNQLNCEFTGIYKGGGASWTADIRVGSDVVNSVALGAVTEGRRFSLNYPCGGVTSVGFRTTASAPQLDVDDLYFGLARNIGSVAQATFVGGMEQAGASGCAYSQNTSTGLNNFVALGTGTGCNAWTVTSNGPGTISAQGTNDHRLVYTNMPAGNYRITLAGSFDQSVTGDTYFRLSDGTNTFQTQGFSGGGIAGVNTLIFDVSYTTQANRTFAIQASDNHAGTVRWSNAAAGLNASWKIYRFPSASEQVFRPDQVAWRVDANISGANPSLGTAAVSSYTGITNGSLTLTNNTGAGVIAAQIPCSATNPPTGTTCAAGDESLGVSFTMPTVGDVLACASFSHQIVGGTFVDATFQIVETPNNAQTILQGGKARIMTGKGSSDASLPNRLCGTFNFASAGQKTLRLFYEQVVGGTPTLNQLLADADVNRGNRDIKWEVYPLNYYQPAPLLIGSVVSNSTGIERVERALALANCTTSPCTLTSQSGGVTSVTRTGTGLYTVNFNGAFSQAPSCVATCTSVGVIEGVADTAVSNSGSLSQFICRRRDTGALVDAAFSIICQGPR